MSKKAKRASKSKGGNQAITFGASGLSVDAQVRESITKMRGVAMQIASPSPSMMGAPPPSPYMIQMADDGSADVYIYGDIGDSWYDDSVTAKGFIDELDALDAKNIRVRISSYGGSVKDGIAIHNAIRRHDSVSAVYIDSVAMSSASLIAMAGDEVHMVDNGLLMIHAPWSYAVGNSKEMRKSADVLDTYATAMATSYARKSTLSNEDALALLTDGEDHYYTAEEAKALGFIDHIVESDSEDEGATASALAPVLSSRYADGVLDFIGRDLPAVAAALQKPGPGNEEEPVMTDVEKAKAKAKQQKEFRAAEEGRRSDIRERFAAHKSGPGVQALLDECLDDLACDPVAAGEKLLAHLGEQSKPVAAVAGQIEMGEDARDKFRAGAESALIIRAGGQADNDTGSELRGMSLRDMAMRSMILAGANQNSLFAMDRIELFKVAARPGMAGGAYSTSDFPALLSNVARKFMLVGHEESEETWQKWTRAVPMSDFKSHDMVGLSEFDNLLKVPEGGEYKGGGLVDYKESIKLAKYGRIFDLSWEAMVNDDLMAFTDIPRKMGMAAARQVGDLVYAVLTANAVMRDNVALFHTATHGNLASSGGAPTTATVDAARVAMGKQKGEKGVATLNIRPVYLLAPLALEGASKVVANSEFEVGASSKNNTVPNSVRGTFEVIADARLDANSASKWYMAANPNLVDTVNVGFLDGQQAPTLEEQAGFEIDGLQWKVRQVAAAKAADWRGVYQNPGA
jgi:ATP-dependent protease ClpP protease subunit